MTTRKRCPLTQSGDDPLLDGPAAGPADGDSHLVVAPQAVELVELVGGVAWAGPDLPGRGGQLVSAGGAVVMVRVVHLTAEPQRIAVNDGAGMEEMKK